MAAVSARRMRGPRLTGRTEKLKASVYRGTVTDKTGELFVAVDAEGWKKTGRPAAKEAMSVGKMPGKEMTGGG